MGVSEDGLLLVEEVLGEIVQQAGNTVYRHHLQRRVVPYAVQRARADSLAVVEWLYLQHDVRSIDNSDASFSDEPEPCPVDSWARGVLDCKTTSVQSTTPPFVQLSNIPTTQPNKIQQSPHSSPTQSQRPHTTPIAKTTPTIHNKGPAKPKQVPQQTNKTNLSKQAVPIRAATAGVTTNTGIHPGPSTAATARSTADSLKQPKASTATSATKDHSKSKQEDETEKFSKFKREIRNRDYIYDHNGNIVIINQTDYDKFPGTTKANMKVNIIPSTTESTSSTTSPTNAGGAPKSSHPTSPQRPFSVGRKKHQDQKTSLASPPSNKYYKEIKLSQPPMMESSVKIAPGVTLHPVDRKKDITAPSPPRTIRKKEPPPQHPPPPPPQQQQQKHEPMLPAIPTATHYQPTTTLTLSPTALYGSTQKMWTTEMLSENFNALLPSIKPRPGLT